MLSTVIGFILAIAVILAAGLGVSDRLWRAFGGDDDRGGSERFLSGAITGIALWITANWILALTHMLTRGSLLVVLAALAIAALVWRPQFSLPRLSFLVIPIALWTLFALWKGAVLPPQSHDALSYHLPKAVMLMRAHGFGHFEAPDGRITNLPANYELLLADVMLLSGSDQLTEWINTIAFLLFLCTTAAFAERWWPSWPSRAAAALVTATAPLLLLHSAADKNDVPLCLFAAAALLWGGRWSARGGRMPMLLTIVSLALAVGTKPNAGAIAAGLAPFLLIRIRQVRPRDAVYTVLAAIAALVLLGGASYADNALHAGAPIAVNIAGVKAGTGLRIEWGDFANLWRVPVLMVIVPFVSSPSAVWVPWRHEYWFWPHYEIYFSHYGALISILVVLLPLCVILFRRIGDDLNRRERRAASLAGAIAVAIILPVHMHPTGMFAALPRYIAFILPVVVAWSVPPLLHELKSRLPLVAWTLTWILAAAFAATAIDCAIKDRFAPLDFVIGAAQHPGTRRVFFMNRAGSVADRMAGPYDTIAVDGGFDTWVYPAYGARFTRPVIFLPEEATPDSIPPSVQWVMVDRSWNQIWENPKLTDMGKFWSYVGRGTPSPEEVRLLVALRHDPRWMLVFYDRQTNNAVFRRLK
jgi:hypothetical protein